MRILLLVLVNIVLTAGVTNIIDHASDQLPRFKNETMGSIRILTSGNGAPVELRDTIGLNSDLMNNEFFMDVMSHGMEEKIPERVVHAKGAGAFGYFIVTHDVTPYCRAKLFSKVGKKTSVVVRFSQSSLDKGEADSMLDSRGFAIKFYTEEGNFDLVGFHTPMFMYKEPFLFQTVSKVIRRNPVTNLRDPNMLWDFITLRHESVNFFTYLFGDDGIPYGYRHLPSFGVHTYQIYNKAGKSYFVRLHITPDMGVKNLRTEEAMRLAIEDPDYAVRDLYNAIACGQWPVWTVSWQLLTARDVNNAKFDVFDITKQLPLKDYPLRPIGKLVLNRNPKNFFADVEQVAFCPGNLVPGILGAPDRAFISRRFAYKDTQRYRLGSNFQRITVNSPRTKMYTYERDGRAPVRGNDGGAPNYYPNSFNGAVPYVDKNRPSLINITQYETEADNFRQATELYSGWSNGRRSRLVQNIIVWSLGKASKSIQQRVVKVFERVHPDLSQRLKRGLIEYAASLQS